MTDSFIVFLNDLPDNWIRIKFKYITSILTCGHAATPEYVDHGIMFLSAQNIKNGFLVLDKYKKIKKELHNKLTNNHRVKKGDLLQVRVGGETTIGETCVVDNDFDFSIYVSLTHIRVNEKSNNDFIKYLCNSSIFKELSSIEMKKGGGVANLNVSDLEKFRIPLPPLREQELISQSLDKKTQQIDSLIEKIEKKIELLKEQKTALINQYVTKGLDPNVEMKNTGVEWIEHIPKHWEIKKGKYILKIHASSNPNSEISDSDGIPLIKVDDLNTITNKYYLTKCNSYLSNSKELPPLPMDILIFPKRGMTILTNKIAISKLKGFLDPNLMGISVFNGVHIKYIFHVIKNRGLGDICDQTTIPQINNKHIYPLEFPLPPFEEQSLIVNSIDKKISSLDLIMNSEKKRLDLLNEYRDSLISSLVTGKIRITEDML